MRDVASRPGAQMRLKCVRSGIVAALAMLAIAASAEAHDARPLSVDIVERTAYTYQAIVRVPPSVDVANRPELTWPDGCAVRSLKREDAAGTGLQTILVTCARSVEGQHIGVHYALFNPSLSTVFRFTPAGGAPRTTVIPPDRSDWAVPAATTWVTVASGYLVLGVEHIWAGVDHLLFVLGLLLVARAPRRIAFAITGFTLAHSVTLSLAALGVVRVPIPPIEAGIALSILFLAYEVARSAPRSLAHRYPVAVSALFGLLHGFGFAAALNEAGLPHSDIPAALLFFNIGVEVGQLAFIAAVLSSVALVRLMLRLLHVANGELAYSRVQAVGAYVLGVPASFWFFERVSALWHQ